MLTRLVESAGCASPPAGGVPVGSGVRAETSGDLMRIRGSGRLLHVAAEEA